MTDSDNTIPGPQVAMTPIFTAVEYGDAITLRATHDKIRLILDEEGDL